MDICYPEYDRSLLSLICSVTAHFSAGSAHPTLPEADRLLASRPKNVVLMLFDGMGAQALRRCLGAESFLRKNQTGELSSVFPSTTVAAVTTLYSAKSPAEHGWLGWSPYFPHEDKIVDAFTNNLKDSQTQAAPYSVAKKYLPYRTVFERIREAGEAQAHEISAFGDTYAVEFDDIFAQTAALCQAPGRKYLYCYWGEPDLSMHRFGYCGAQSRAWIERIDDACAKLCARLSDTLVFIIADHGHRAVDYDVVSDFPELAAMCLRPTAIEPRAAAFFIKPACRDAFPAAFHAAFGRENYLLLSKDEVLARGLFGSGTPHADFADMLGDYLAVAVGGKCLVWNEHSKRFASHHAGLTRNEMRVPLIVVQT